MGEETCLDWWPRRVEEDMAQLTQSGGAGVGIGLCYESPIYYRLREKLLVVDRT